MASLFANRFLRFKGPSFVPGKKWALFWPVYAWKVSYPDPDEKGLNLFQRAILGLMRARETDPEVIGELLGLAPALVRYIIATQLVGKGFLDSQGILTSKGSLDLEEIERAQQARAVGYAFQDALTGEVFPRFSTQLEEIEPAGTRNGYPEFLLNRERGYRESPFCIVPRDVKFSALDPGELFEAYSRYRRDYHNAKNLDLLEDLPSRTSFQEIGCIDQEPVAMYLWCWLYSAPGGSQPWLVSDPFGLRKAVPWLREPAKKLAEKTPPLARMIGNLLGSTREEVDSGDYLDRIDDQAMLEVFSDYPWISGVPRLNRYLPALLRQKTLVESRANPGFEQVDSLAVEAQKLGECVLQWLLKEWPGPSRHRLPRDNQSRHDFYLGLKALGLEGISDNVASSLCGVSARAIRRAARTGNESIKALLVTNLLASSEHSDHPLRLLDVESKVYERLVNLADLRNKAGHASGVQLDRETTLELAEFSLEWAQLFKEWC